MKTEQENAQKQPTKLHTFSQEYLHYKSNLLDTFKQFHKSTMIQDIYLTERCNLLTLNERITEVEMFGCGFKKIYHRKNISPYLKLEKIIILAIIDQENIKQLAEIQYLFPQIHLMTLQTTNSLNAPLLRNSEIKKSIRSIKEIELNFFTFLDGVHYIEKIEKSFLFKTAEEQKISYKYERPSKSKKLGSYRSFLMSYPKLYEYQIHFVKTTNQQYNQFVDDLWRQLEESLGILQKHERECKNFDKVSSPKIKCLVLNRDIIDDLISPLIYGYYYGTLCEQFINRDKLIQGAQKLASKGKMYNELFEKDFDQAAEYIQKLTNDKTALQGPFETNYFYKAKHIIVSYEDPSPIELSLHISCWRQTRQYGESKIKPATLQQDIANRIDEFQRKVSNGNCISKIKDWILESTEDEADQLTEDELVKLGMVTQMTGDLWFFHHNSIKKLLHDQNHKIRYENFLARRKSQIPKQYLTEKPQQEERSQLYRHHPKLLKICQKWIDLTLNEKQKQNNQKPSRSNSDLQFDKKCINNDILRYRESKLVILIDGIVGYNELALLRRIIKEKTDKKVTFLVESFCNTQQYADYLMRPLNTNKNGNTK